MKRDIAFKSIRNRFRIGLIILCASTLSGTLRAQQTSAKSFPPNVVLIFVDDVGYGEIGCYGYRQVPTPHIDALAENGVRFTAGYVSSPFCAPSRAGLLTGKFQTRFGYEFNPVGIHNENPDVGLPAGQQTIANALINRGYATALIGKWHLGGNAKFHPMRKGFDEFFGFLHEGHSYAFPPWNDVTSFVARRALPDGSKGVWIGDGEVYSTEEGSYIPVYDANNPILRSSQPVVEEEYLTDAFTREAISFIERKKNQPFFLNVTYNAVHTPNQAANQYMKKFEHIEDMEERIDAAMLSNLDDGVGAIVKKIKEVGLEDNTIIIFLSDNGAPIIERPRGNGLLRGGKGGMYEGGIRVPFVMQWKGKVSAGMVYDDPVSACDIFPTVVAAAGGNVPKDLDGLNLIQYITGKEKQPDRNLFWRMGHQTALISGDWKLVNDQKDKKAWELYDLSNDVSEKRNLFRENPAKALELMTIWEQYDNEMAEPIFTYK